MDRRQFLGTAAGAGAVGWLAHYFLGQPAWAGDDEESKKGIAAMGDVADAYRRASAVGKPLLILVIPAKDDRKYERGQVFGALLNHGGAGVYLDLALCELVCAKIAQVNRELKGLEIKGEPLMLLVETDGAAPRSTAIDPQLQYDFGGVGFDKVEALVKERLDKVAEALHAAVAPDAATIAARAAVAETRLGADAAKALRAAVVAGKPAQPETLDRGAAIVRAAAENPDARRLEALESLAAGAAKRVAGPAPAGAKWAESTGCGVAVEGEPAALVGCGMGQVPKLSQRFLWFFTQ